MSLATSDILRLVPHRAPFLMIDRIETLEPGVRVTGYKNVSLGDPVGVDPVTGAPVLPPPMLIEAVGQAALVLIKHQPGAMRSFIPIFAGCDCVFYGDVTPPCRLDVEATIEKLMSVGGIIVGRVSVGGRLIAEMRLTATFFQPDEQTEVPG